MVTVHLVFAAPRVTGRGRAGSSAVDLAEVRPGCMVLVVVAVAYCLVT